MKFGPYLAKPIFKKILHKLLKSIHRKNRPYTTLVFHIFRSDSVTVVEQGGEAFFTNGDFKLANVDDELDLFETDSNDSGSDHVYDDQMETDSPVGFSIFIR